MGEIEDLEARIVAAFARISAGVVALSDMRDAAPVAEVSDQSEALAELQEALEDERMVKVQLEERLRLLSDQRAVTEAALQGEIEVLVRKLDAQGLDVQSLSVTVSHLREDLRRLREGAEQGVVDPSLINRAMLAELEALRSTRAAEVNELSDILASLGGVLDAEEAHAHA